MPIYEYECTSCKRHAEFVQKFSDKPKTKCETCGGKLKKLISASAFHLKGGGWYKTDYSGSNASAAKPDKPADAAAKPACEGCPNKAT